jgi:CheY-like chemotaxis protein
MAENLSAVAGAGDHTERLLSDIGALLLEAQEAVDRVRRVARDLRVFSHANDDELHGPVACHTVLKSAIRMASNEIRHRARLVTEFRDVAPVQANEGRLGQVFLNLIVNAAQAIPDGRAADNEIRIATRQEGSRVIVEIADTGSGMSPEHLSRMFTSFFTTKAAGVGTGLGLMICHRIVKGFGGDITVQSNIGRGTVFKISLPCASPTLVEVKAVVDARTDEASAAVVRRCRILVVDDEPTLCATIARMLESEHDVVKATEAKEALTLIKAGERFDLILSDLMMPDITGCELYATIAEIAPDQARKMIFMTGGAFSEQSAAFLRSLPNRSIDKPFKVAALRKLLNDQM